jgi:hypothetical protein
VTIERPSGMRLMQTFRKLPTAAPARVKMTASHTIENMPIHHAAGSRPSAVLSPPVIGDVIVVGMNPEFIRLPVVVKLRRGVDDDRLFRRNAFEAVIDEGGDMDENPIVDPCETTFSFLTRTPSIIISPLGFS